MKSVGRTKPKPFYFLPRAFGFMPSRWRETEIETQKFDTLIAQSNLAILGRLVVVLVTAWMFISAYLDVIGFRCDDSMFQRSSAVLVGMALLVEITAINSPHRYLYNSYPGKDLREVDLRINKYKVHGVRIGLCATLLGTVVWAYGDLVSSGPMC